MTHDSFAVSQNVADLFQKENNISLHFVKSGDAGALVNKAILTKNAPQADVIYGVDNTFLSRALTAGMLRGIWYRARRYRIYLDNFGFISAEPGSASRLRGCVYQLRQELFFPE